MDDPKITTLAISLKSEIVSSNFEQFRTETKATIKALVYTLKSDADFSTAEANVKKLKATSKALKEAKALALAEAEEVSLLFAAIDDIDATAREAWLKLDKQIKTRKAARKNEIVADAIESVTAFSRGNVTTRIEAAVKGKRNFDTMTVAANAEAKVMQDGINAARAIIETHIAANGSTLIPDPETLEWMDAEALSLELNRRLERQQSEKEKADLKAKIAKQEAEVAAAQKKKDDDAAAVTLAAETKRKADAAAAASAKAKAAVVDTAAGPKAKAEPRVSNGKMAAMSSTPPVVKPAPAVTRPTTEPESEYDKMFGAAEPEDTTPPVTQSDELQSYLNTIKEAFGPVKAARAELCYVDNIERAKAFADAIAHAWAALTK